jgi:endonuclease IV
MDGSLRIGIHTSIAGDIVQALDIAHRIGANAVQIFSSSPRMWVRPQGGSRIARLTPRDLVSAGPHSVWVRWSSIPTI